VASWRESVSPYSGGTVPVLHRSSLTARRYVAGNLASPFVPGLAIALDLDGVLADTRPLWDAWLEDASRRARVELTVPDDREAAAAVLDEELGDWRPLLARFAADRAPLWVRPRADTNAALRRLAAAGARIGTFSDAPRELAELALAHAGAARLIEVVGTLAEVEAALGESAVVVRSREELAALRLR
jgi:phosphoglycolate phosphatase-like HAD superfamily hydrolase